MSNIYHAIVRLAIVFIVLFFTTAKAAEITRVDNTIYFNGSIEPGDFAEFAELARHGDKLDLRSGGGYLHEAIKIGHLVNNYGIKTIIAKDQECASACGLIFLAGKSRQFDGLLGIHCSYIKDTEGCYKPGIQTMHKFLLEVSTQKIADFYLKNAQQREMKWFKR